MPQESFDRGHQFLGPFTLQLRAGPDHTMGSVILKKFESDLVQGRLDRGHLGDDVDAVAVVFDHRFNPADLTLDPPQTLHNSILVIRVSVPAGFLLVGRHIQRVFPVGVVKLRERTGLEISAGLKISAGPAGVGRKPAAADPGPATVGPRPKTKTRPVLLAIVLTEGPADLVHIQTGGEAGEQLHPGSLG